MEKKLYIHVGTPKTGTSAIQRFCWWNKDLLKSKGYSFPVFAGEFKWVPDAHNGFFLAKSFKDAEGNHNLDKEHKYFVKYMDRVMEQSEGCDVIILTDENLWRKDGRREELWTDIKAYAEERGFQVVIVAYLRRQDEYLSSFWAQKVKAGYSASATFTWEEWVESRKNDEALNYASRVDDFVKVFGKENVVLRRYDRSKFYGGDIFSDFLNIIGLEKNDDYVIKTENVNVSIKGNAIELRRVLNSIPDVDKEGHLFIKLMQLKCAEISAKEYDPEMFSLEERKQFLELYKEGNSRLAKEFFGESGELFECEETSKPVWDKDNPYMINELIRFTGTIALHFEEENAKLKQEIEDLRHPFKAWYRKMRKKVKKFAKKMKKKFKK